MLKLLFTKVYSFYDQKNQSEHQWKKLEKAYSSRARYYHNLNHLQSLQHELLRVKGVIDDWDVLIMTLFFHDYVYNTLRTDNELRSAKYARKVLTTTTMKPAQVKRCYLQITGTKEHKVSEDMDANFFNDADLAILASSKEIYNSYLKNIRKEYQIYPAPIYTAGRRKIVRSFLDMERIFKTDFFYDKYEYIARENLERELKNESSY